jgi:hypothetical protein
MDPDCGSRQVGIRRPPTLPRRGDFDLGGANIWKAGGSIDYAFTNRIHGNVGVDYTEFTYGQSPVGIGGFFEPHSRTEDWTLRIGAGYSFYSDSKSDYRPLK